MNKQFIAADTLDFGPEGVPVDLPSLGAFLGRDAAPLTYEAGRCEDPIRLYCADPGDLDMAAANGLSRWVAEIRGAVQPWDLWAIEGCFTPPTDPRASVPVKPAWATALALPTLHGIAYTLRWMLPGEAAALLTPTDQVILSILARPRGATGPALMVHVSVEGAAIEDRLGQEQWAALIRRCAECEAQLLPTLLEERRWFQASGVLRIDLAIRVLPEPIYRKA
ncbi:hypothetical protein [Thalassobaculum sp.]|uniref:hypothetical protein n=1 Tax=Thalassobaculum sp. TaxID=2022740 RepID=UPI003B5A40E6